MTQVNTVIEQIRRHELARQAAEQRVKSAQFEADSLKTTVSTLTTQLKTRLKAGESTGDPVRDFVIATGGSMDETDSLKLLRLLFVAKDKIA